MVMMIMIRHKFVGYDDPNSQDKKRLIAFIHLTEAIRAVIIHQSTRGVGWGVPHWLRRRGRIREVATTEPHPT